MRPATERGISAPGKDTAKTEVLIIEEVLTRIKQLIVNSLCLDEPKRLLERAISREIAVTVQNIKDLRLAKAVKDALTTSAKKWYFQYKRNQEILEYCLLRNLRRQGIEVTIDTEPTSRSSSRPDGSSNAKEAGPSKKPDGNSDQDDKSDAPTTGVSVSTQQRGNMYHLNITRQGNVPIQLVYSQLRPYLTFNKHAIVLIEDYEKQVREEIKALSSDPAIVSRFTADGKPYTVGLRNLAEMTVRYQANKKDIDRLRSEGVRLVWTTSHANCSVRCEPYQGRLFSLDGTSGVMQGYRFEPIEAALAGPKGDGNGIISGYNCRHRLIEFKTGSLAPREFTESEVKHERYVNNSMRRRENSIRQMKAQELLSRTIGDRDAANQLRIRWKKAEARYQAFALRNNSSFSRWRCALGEDERSLISNMP